MIATGEQRQLKGIKEGTHERTSDSRSGKSFGHRMRIAREKEEWRRIKP